MSYCSHLDILKHNHRQSNGVYRIMGSKEKWKYNQRRKKNLQKKLKRQVKRRDLFEKSREKRLLEGHDSVRIAEDQEMIVSNSRPSQTWPGQKVHHNSCSPSRPSQTWPGQNERESTRVLVFDDNIALNSDLFFECNSKDMRIIVKVNGVPIHIPVMYSTMIDDLRFPSEVKNLFRSFALKLILSSFNTSNGITITADMPFGATGVMNITRPAVLRAYFGRNIEIVSPTKWRRYSYGCPSPHGTISIDPRVYNTKPMCEEMHLLGLVLKECAIKYYKKRGINSLFLENDYNHCTMLIYCHHSRNKTCKMPFHCDTLYNKKDEFSSHNTIKNNSAVLVYTVGDERNIHFRMRHYGT